MPLLWFHKRTMLSHQEFDQELGEGRYYDLKSVCQTKDLKIFSAWQGPILWQGPTPVVLMVMHDDNLVHRCEYSNQEYQERDIEFWRKGLGGDEGAGAGARLIPTPPTLIASNARPYPPDTETEQPAV